MSTNSIRSTWVGCAVIALAALTSSTASAAISADENKNVPPLAVAQELTQGADAVRTPLPPIAFPAHQRGVREAAAESNEALRRYIWRTRMIHNFYYKDFAREE